MEWRYSSIILALNSTPQCMYNEMKYILSQYLRIKIRRKFTHAIERNWE
jgi:hypothetical protein